LSLRVGPKAFLAFSPNLPSISPGEKCALSRRTCSRTPAGVALSLESDFRGLGRIDRIGVEFGRECRIRGEHRY
jgi:hypothetical protein